MTSTPSASRRNVLAGSAAAGVGLVVAGSVPSLAHAEPGRLPQPGGAGSHTPFPPLVDDPHGILALPPGFSYTVVTRAGQTRLKTGQPTPSNHDGTAVFSGSDGRYLLIQNHECGANAPLGVPQIEGTVYDPGVGLGGGCTVIATDAAGTNLGEWVGISGTLTNCAGGPTPWGTWLTCEETESRAGNGRLKDHGYVFEVQAQGTKPVPLKALGRYAHEALAIDADRRHVYLSEDASGPNGLFYRWSAPAGYRLRPGLADSELTDPTFGTLAAMQIILPDGSVLPDVAYLTSAQLGRPYPVRWKEVPERDGKTMSVRKQFADGEVTRGKKFEGVYGTNKGVYVVNSYAFNTGDLPADAAKHDGMVWFYDYETETITLVTYFPHQETAANGLHAKYDDLTFDGPDNVTVTPWGTLVLAEDGAGASHVLSSVPGGPTYAIARNQLNIGTADAPEYSEFTGPTFTEDGKVLFVNIQTPGLTLAITGPWEQYLG